MLVLVLFVGAVSGWAWLTLSLARYRAIRDRRREVQLFGGLVRLVLWEQNEGLIFLRDKSVSEVVCDGGGIRWIWPIRGEELRARVPLTLRMLTWEDKAIPTHESIQVAMKVAVWWRVADLRKYVFSIDAGIHVGDTHAHVGVLEAAETWLKTLTESTLRTLVSEASVASLISSRAVDYLQSPSRLASPAGEGATGAGSPESLTGDLSRDLAGKALDYGLEIQRVEIQSIRLAPEIQEAIDRVWTASLLPAQSEGEARARTIATGRSIRTRRRHRCTLGDPSQFSRHVLPRRALVPGHSVHTSRRESHGGRFSSGASEPRGIARAPDRRSVRCERKASLSPHPRATSGQPADLIHDNVKECVHDGEMSEMRCNAGATFRSMVHLVRRSPRGRRGQ